MKNEMLINTLLFTILWAFFDREGVLSIETLKFWFDNGKLGDSIMTISWLICFSAFNKSLSVCFTE